MLGCGGESTVTLAPAAGFGEGGPNQEAAIAAALELERAPVAAVFLDTDGSVIPATMLDLKLENIWNGFMYCIEFRKPLLST